LSRGSLIVVDVGDVFEVHPLKLSLRYDVSAKLRMGRIE
jgi:hypothetical protein